MYTMLLPLEMFPTLFAFCFCHSLVGSKSFALVETMATFKASMRQ